MHYWQGYRPRPTYKYLVGEMPVLGIDIKLHPAVLPLLSPLALGI